MLDDGQIGPSRRSFRPQFASGAMVWCRNPEAAMPSPPLGYDSFDPAARGPWRRPSSEEVVPESHGGHSVAAAP